MDFFEVLKWSDYKDEAEIVSHIENKYNRLVIESLPEVYCLDDLEKLLNGIIKHSFDYPELKFIAETKIYFKELAESSEFLYINNKIGFVSQVFTIKEQLENIRQVSKRLFYIDLLADCLGKMLEYNAAFVGQLLCELIIDNNENSFMENIILVGVGNKTKNITSDKLITIHKIFKENIHFCSGVDSFTYGVIAKLLAGAEIYNIEKRFPDYVLYLKIGE